MTRRWLPVLGLIGAIVAFLITRLVNLDADIPAWALSQYSPIDEFAYVVPAFNLNLYGSWVHQAAPFAPIEGLPMNAAQNVVTAASIRLIGDDYWGMRVSSVLFGLVVFLGLIAVVRQQVDDARRLDGIPATLGIAVIGGTVVLLLADFSSLLAGRIVEPTVTRLAAAILIVFLVGRGTFLGPAHGIARSAMFGVVVAAAVMFVYIYNLFLVPAALVTLAWWAYQSGGWSNVVRHAAVFLAGAFVVVLCYLVLVYVVYGHTPIEWYRTWLGSFTNSSRATGLSIEKVLSILRANVFRLDPAFLGVFLAALPIFVWGVLRRASPMGILIAAGLVFYVAQAAFVADYPARKFVAILVFAVPIVAAGAIHLGAFKAWLRERPGRAIAAGVWLAGVAVLTILEPRLNPVPSNTARMATIVLASGALGATAMAILAVSRWRVVSLIGAAGLSVAVLAPLVYADWTFVYRRPTYTFRDAQVEVRDVVDDEVTAGGWSIAMQLYNSSRPVLSGYHNGQTRLEYEQDVVRMFASGSATSMFDYVDEKSRTNWEGLGFRLIDTYDIRLPQGRALGRYVFEGPVSWMIPDHPAADPRRPRTILD